MIPSNDGFLLHRPTSFWLHSLTHQYDKFSYRQGECFPSLQKKKRTKNHSGVQSNWCIFAEVYSLGHRKLVQKLLKGEQMVFSNASDSK